MFFLTEETSVIWLRASESIFGMCSLWLSGILLKAKLLRLFLVAFAMLIEGLIVEGGCDR